MDKNEESQEKTGVRKMRTLSSKKEDSSSSNKIRVLFIAAMILGYGSIWYVKNQRKEVAQSLTDKAPNTEVVFEEDFGVIFNTPITEKPEKLFSEMPQIYKPSCASTEERFYCERIPGLKNSPWAASTEDKIIRVAFNGMPFRDKGFELFKEFYGTGNYSKKFIREHVWTYALIHLLREHFQNVTDEEIKNHRVRLEFWSIEENEPVLGYSVFFPDGYRIVHLAKIAGRKNPLQYKSIIKSESTYNMIKQVAVEGEYYGQKYEGKQKP